MFQNSCAKAKHVDFAALGYSLMPVLLAMRYINSPPDSRTYGPSHWFLNYHNGFMRRALVGQIFSHWAFISWRSIFLIEAAILLCVVIVTYVIFRSILFGQFEDRRLAVFLLAGPAFLPHLAYMGGEMDNFLYIALLLATWSLLRLGNRSGLLLATAFVIIGLLIHEAFIFMFYPLIIVILIDLLHRRRLHPFWVGLHVTAIISCFIVILISGKIRGAQSEWVTYAQRHTDMPIESAVYAALHNTFMEQIHFALRLYSHFLVARIILTLLLSIPYWIILWRLLTIRMRLSGYSIKVSIYIVLIFLCPLLLVPLGHDAMRWIAALCINISLYILFLHREDQTNLEKITRMQSAFSHVTTIPAYSATFIYLIILGPWGLAGNRLFSNINSLFFK